MLKKQVIKAVLLLIIQSFLMSGISFGAEAVAWMNCLSPELQINSLHLNVFFAKNLEFLPDAENARILRTSSGKLLQDIPNLNENDEWLAEQFTVLDNNGKEKEFVLKEYIDQILTGIFAFPEAHQGEISRISALSNKDLWAQWVSVREGGTLSNYSSFSELLDFFTYQPAFMLHYIFYVNLRELQTKEESNIIKQKYIFIEILKRWADSGQSVSREKNQQESRKMKIWGERDITAMVLEYPRRLNNSSLSAFEQSI